MRMITTVKSLLVGGLLIGLLAGCTSLAPATPTETPAAAPIQAETPTAASAQVEIPVATPTWTETLAPAYEPLFEEADCAFEVPAGYRPICGYLTVPEDRSQPDGRTIRLHVAIFKSTASDPEPDPVFHLVGGPGGSLLDGVSLYLERGGAEILERRDYVLFNQRGTSYSGPDLFCLPYDQYLWEAYERDLSLEEYNAGAVDELAVCLTEWREQGVNLAAYNSAENAADVNDLRLALGYDRVNLYGVSYGSRLALTVMRDYPHIVRSAIIDAVYPPQVNLLTEVGVNAHRALRVLFAACAEDSACSTRYGDIESKFYEVIDRLDASPVTIPIEGPYRAYSVRLDGDLFIDAMFGSLYSVRSIVYIPLMIDTAYHERYTALSEAVGGALGSPLSHGMHFSVLCREEVPFEAAAGPLPEESGIPDRLRTHFDNVFYPDVCVVWDISPAGAVENEPVVSDVPTLVLAGRFDPITPPRWAELAAQTLSRHCYYVFPNVGHGVMRTDLCARQIGLAFLDDPTREPDTSCMGSLESIEFR